MLERLKDKIKKIIARGKPIEAIISKLNPIITLHYRPVLVCNEGRGSAEHKRISYHSQATFIKLDHWIYILG